MATLKEVAKLAGVNISTASRALNGSRSISKATMELVKGAAEELGYTPNLNARVLAGKKSNIIGIIVPEINSDYYSVLIENLENRLQEKGYYLIIANTCFDSSKDHKILENFVNFNVAGVFIACVTYSSDIAHYCDLLKKKNIPLIALDVRLGNVDCNHILVDDAFGIDAAVSFLVGRGHMEIGFIGEYFLELTGRIKMFRQAVEHNGLKYSPENVIVHPTKRFAEAGYEGMMRFLSRDSYPAAYIAGYDAIAIGAMRAVYEKGLRIPQDIAIIGNDNGRTSGYLSTGLTTIFPPVGKMAELGVELMLSCIAGNEEGISHQITLKPELIIRESA